MLTEQAMLEQEAQIPELARQATSLARKQAFAAGHVVLAVVDNMIVSISPDGIQKQIKPSPPTIPVKPGQYRFKLRTR